ncbi:MAG TPA: hypothetical protein VHK46_08180 [Gaiellaceae bacterium]|nr:hypothetical protein [Gaiellaceae bacterium]
MSTAEFDPTPGAAPAQAPEPQLPPLTLTHPAPPEPPAPVAAPAAPAPMSVTDMRDVPLGTLIFREGLLTEEQLEEALQDGMRRGKRLGEVLLERGLVSERDLGRLLAGQKGLQFVELDTVVVDPSAVGLLQVEKARLHSVLPIGFQDGLPVVAVADPTNDLVIENVRRALNCEPRLVVAGREALQRQIDLAYGAAASVPVEPLQPQPVEPAPAPAPLVEPAPVAEAPLVPPVEPVAPVVQPVGPAYGDDVWLAEPAPPVAQPEPVVPVEPVVQPVEPVVQPVVEVEPAFAVEPVAPAPQEAPAPLSISFTPMEQVQQPVFEPESQAAPEPQAAAPVFEPVAAEAQPEPAPAADEQPEEIFTVAVVLRLADGERLQVGAFPTSDEALAHARTVVQQLSADSGWPFFEGRFIRPDGIVSVDLVEPEGRWLGSAARRQWAAE